MKSLHDINLAIARGADAGHHRRERLWQHGPPEDRHRPVHPTRGWVLFDGQDLARLDEPGLGPAADPLRIRVPASGLVRQHDDRPERGLSFAAAHPKTTAEMAEIVLARLSEVGLPENVRFKKPAELSGGMRKRVGRPGPGPGAGSGALRRANDGPGPHHERRDQRTDPGHPPPPPGNERDRDARHEVGPAGGRSDRHVYPLPRLKEGEPQIIFDGTPADLERSRDRRVTQFVRGEAGERLMEMQQNGFVR